MGLINITRGQIIEEALSLAGRPDLTASARLWLNMYLEKIYYSQDHDWLVKGPVSLSVAEGLDFPDDYRAARSAQLVPSSGGRKELDIITDSAHYQEKRRQYGTSLGDPQTVYADRDTRKFYFLPQPDQAVSMDLFYFYIPEIPDHTISATDLDEPKWDMPVEILIDYIKTRAMEFNDDDRHSTALGRVDMDYANAKFNDHDRRGGPSRLAMGKRFRNKKRF